jgi:glycyl-tRNA synthetase alpha subunit
MNAMSKQSSDLNEVISHFELQLKKSSSSSSADNKDNNEVVKFEMNRSEVDSMLQQFKQIETCCQQILQKGGPVATN